MKVKIKDLTDELLEKVKEDDLDKIVEFYEITQKYNENIETFTSFYNITREMLEKLEEEIEVCI